MMKHISKKVLLFGALTMLMSSAPMQAMEDAPTDVQEELAKKQGHFARLTQKAKTSRLRSLKKEVNTHVNRFLKCVETKEGCPRALAWTIRGLVISMMALLALRVMGVGAHVGARGYATTRLPVTGRPLPGARAVGKKVIQIEGRPGAFFDPKKVGVSEKLGRIGGATPGRILKEKFPGYVPKTGKFHPGFYKFAPAQGLGNQPAYVDIGSGSEYETESSEYESGSETESEIVYAK